MRSRSAPPQSGFRKALLPTTLILASLMFVGAILASNFLNRPPDIDQETSCRKNAPLEYHTVLIVDATDAFTRDQAARLRASVSDERAALPRYGKFTILFVTPGKPFEPEEILVLCNPGSGKAANPLLSNPGQIEGAWQKKFAEPIDAAVTRLLNLPTAKRSPILETITAATWRHDFDGRVAHRRLRIVSDMLQHEARVYSHYQPGDPWKHFTRSALMKNVEADLTGVFVQIDYFRRPDAMQFQNDLHRKFWERWLTERGAGSVNFGEPPRASPTAFNQTGKVGIQASGGQDDFFARAAR